MISDQENQLLTNKNVLIFMNNTNDKNTYYYDYMNKKEDYFKNNFCGKVITTMDELMNHQFDPSDLVYLCASYKQVYEYIKNNKIYIVEEFASDYEYCTYEYDEENDNDNGKEENNILINSGEIPINIHGLGVYFRNFFDESTDIYSDIIREHKFQSLTESTKPTNAFRKGIYLTPVEKDENNDLEFNLLRCSSNLSGPTDNFRQTDHYIVDKVNDISKYFFKEQVDVNHVLAQIYVNSKTNSFLLYMMYLINLFCLYVFGKQYFSLRNTEKKAKIKAHSDKTKDMPRNAVMAFCTFYKSYYDGEFNDDNLKHLKRSSNDQYDFLFNKTSALTVLHFRRKPMVDPSYVKDFSITLYPNSVFLMPLSTNRLYTHEIKPSVLPIDKMPTRMGYVIRCSKTKAIYKNGNTFVKEDDGLHQLNPITPEDAIKLKEKYYIENTTIDLVNYDHIYHSMNSGDYKKPIY